MMMWLLNHLCVHIDINSKIETFLGFLCLIDFWLWQCLIVKVLVLSMSNNVIVRKSSLLLEEFTVIFNKCLRSGIYPALWQHSVMVPIPKISNPKILNNLRPISLLPVFGKIQEKIIHTRLHNYFLVSGNNTTLVK